MGPLWFEEGSGDTVTVNQQRILGGAEEVLRASPNEAWQPHHRPYVVPARRCASSHRETTLKWIENHFGDRLISRGASRNWPTCSSDLTPMDILLWGHLKGQVYKEGPEGL